jgi:hypothetical protein
MRKQRAMNCPAAAPGGSYGPFIWKKACVDFDWLHIKSTLMGSLGATFRFPKVNLAIGLLPPRIYQWVIKR